MITRLARAPALSGLCLAALSGILITAEPAHAVETARVEGFGPVSRGFAGGGVAHPVGAAASLLNPAELLRLDSPQELMFQLTYIMVSIEVENSATGEVIDTANYGRNRGPYFLPEVAYAVKSGHWAFGTGVLATGGFGIEYGTDSFLSSTTTGHVATGLPISTRVAQLRIPFAVAYAPSDRWRLGASFDVVNASVNLATLLDVQQVRMLIQSGRVSGNLVPLLRLDPTLVGAHINFVRDNTVASELAAWGIAGRLGLSYELSPDTSLGVSYEFETRLHDLKGQGSLTAVGAANGQVVLDGDGSLPQFQFPRAFVLGVSHRFSPGFAVIADLRRTFWAEVLGDTVIRFRGDKGGTLEASLPTGFNNLTTLALGAEWQFAQSWTIRGGGAHAFQTTVKPDHLNGTLPTLSQSHLTTTLAYRSSGGHEFDAGVTYGFTDPVHNPGNNVNSVPAIEGRNRQINPVLGYSYHF